MVYTVVVDIIVCVALAVTGYFALNAPYSYIAGVLLITNAIAKCFYLHELIEEIRAAQPVRKSRKKKQPHHKARVIATVLSMELIAVTALYILYSNGVTIIWPVLALVLLFAMVMGLYLSW